MRVLIVSEGLPSAQSLYGLFAFDQAKALASCGVEVFFFAIDIRSIRRWRHWGVTEGITDGVHWYLYSLPVGKAPLVIRYTVGRLMLIKLFKQVFKDTKIPDIIHAHFVGNGIIACYLSKKTNIPLIITEHSSSMNVSPIPKTLKKYATNAYSLANKVLAVSSCLSDNILKEFGIKSEVVPNIVDLCIFNQCVPKEHEGFRIVTTSGLVEGKGVINLIKAVQRASDSIPQLHLDIIGDGVLRGELEKYVADNNLKDLVSFLGYLSREKALKVYERSDCFSMLSERETFGVVYAEAMAAGLPIIATRCGGPEDFIDKEVGILVEVNDIDEASGAILYLYKNLNNFNRNTIIERANIYNSDSIAMKLINIYNRI